MKSQTQDAHQQRVKQQQEVKKLHEQQWSQKAIAQEVGVSVRTVRRLLSRSDLPETPTRRSTFGVSILEPYKQMLLEWWNTGIRKPKVLMALLQQKGYGGSQRTLERYQAPTA